MRAKSVPVAVVSSDWHLTDKVPASRACTKEEWYREMEERVTAMVEKANELKVPLVVAGDVFHTWKEPVALVDRVTDWLGECREWIHMIPGQHDLPYHRLDLLKDSPLQLLRLLPKVNVIDGLASESLGGGWSALFCPWGQWKNIPEDDPNDDVARWLLVAHRFVYTHGSFPGADPAGKIYSSEMVSKLRGFDAAVFGDNHSPFECNVNGTKVWNNGSVLRHKKNERDDFPRFGVLYSDGHFEENRFHGCDKEKWTDGEIEYAGPEESDSLDLSQVTAKVVDLARAGHADFKGRILQLIATGHLSKRACEELVKCLPDD